MRYGSVCSGIEAATMAWHTLGWVPAFFSEIDKFPSAVLAHHYGSNMPGEPLAKNGIPNHGDFTQIGPEAGPVDLLVGGTPCQSFSVAGKRLGLDDPRGNLALEYLSLARRLRARWIVWENVPGVLSSYSGAEQAAREVQEGPVGGEGIGIEDRDFAMFLSFVRECGYGFAYRVLDAQFVRVDGLARAVPQRRERVFLVGYLGDWRPAAAVLLEPEGMRRDPAPSRKAGQGFAADVAPSIVSSGRGVERAGDTRGQDPVVAVHVDAAARCVTAGYAQRLDWETENFVAHSLRPEGFDASEDGSGRGTPIVPVAFDWYASQSQSLPIDEGVSPPLKTTMQPAMQQGWAVRRLTPRECERLQGFPDDFTNVPYRGKPAADGPRYKALGNSMAVNAMRWIGQRIDIMEKIIQQNEDAA